MGSDIDASWEYYAPDPEIAEAMESRHNATSLERAFSPTEGCSGFGTIKGRKAYAWREEFARLYMAGVKMAVIAVRLKKTVHWLKRMRSRLGLPARPKNFGSKGWGG